MEEGQKRNTPLSLDATSVDAKQLRFVEQSLRGLRYGSVTIVVQDGVIVQIDRTEKNRIIPRT